MSDIIKKIKKIKELRLKCKSCGGSGWVTETFGASNRVLGSYNKNPCYVCGGTGEKIRDPSNYLV